MLEVCRNYERAINEGDVPNIESAWNCVCRSETLKAFKMVEETLDRKIAELSDSNCLTNEEMEAH